MIRKILIFLINSLLLSFCTYSQNVKKCEFCGYFYPAESTELDTSLNNFLNEAAVELPKGQILGLISPHAGYIYSGKVAGYAFKSIKDKKFDTVILLGQSHRYYFNGVAIYPAGYFNTPIGDLEIDEETIREFKTLKFVKFNTNYFYTEHSLEVLLPFLLKTLGKVKIVPVIFGENSYKNLEEFAEKLSVLSSSKKILVIVSTDLSHYLPYNDAIKIDMDTLKIIENQDEQKLISSEVLNTPRACALGPLISFIIYSKKKNAKIKFLKYLNSGDTAGDKDRVVGYASAILYIPE